MDVAILGLIILIGGGLYFLPTIIAETHRTGIFWLNLIFGWTVLGWIAAFIWAFAEQPSPKDEPARPWSAETDAWNFHAQQFDNSDHWVLGIEDFVESRRFRSSLRDHEFV
jgi:Superinfection immunity protein